MKKLTITAVLILLTTLIIVVVITFSPKKIHINTQGIKYRLGTEHLKSEEPVNVKIEGKLYKSISGKRRFAGTIDIEGEKIPVPADQRKLNIPITSDGWGAISYPYFVYRKEDGVTVGSHTYQYGSLVINNDFTKVSILVSDQNQINDNGGVAWNAENGQMITVPASSRSEAIRISNEIMELFLKGYTLK
ncbi:hypothetical protein P9847_08695 [Paenibacillus chibensis]|uniref:Uncharacterized protein n=1 Tax=Paenibacillus chibensis TaxID=59846 RepID=A0ABU6PR94_9BACL|nr:hypothetical protein [Paenibacillus chibensis]